MQEPKNETSSLTRKRRKAPQPEIQQLPVEYRKLLSNDFKSDGLTEVLDERLNRSREYQKKFYKTNRTSKRTILCEKCGYLFLSKGWYRHKISCDGTGPKATDFRVNENRESSCPYCGKDFRWQTSRRLANHKMACDKNPNHEQFLYSRKLAGDYTAWIRTGRKPRYQETYLKIEKHLRKQGLSDEAIKIYLEDIKKGSN